MSPKKHMLETYPWCVSVGRWGLMQDDLAMRDLPLWMDECHCLGGEFFLINWEFSILARLRPFTVIGHRIQTLHLGLLSFQNCELTHSCPSYVIQSQMFCWSSMEWTKIGVWFIITYILTSNIETKELKQKSEVQKANCSGSFVSGNKIKKISESCLLKLFEM